MQGSELRKLRKRAGATQGQMARALSVSPGFVGEMERGEKAVDERTAMRAVALYAPLRPIMLVGHGYDGECGWLAEGMTEARMAVRNWMPPLSAPDAPAITAPVVAFREVAKDEQSGVTVFAPAGDTEWTDERAMQAARNIGLS